MELPHSHSPGGRGAPEDTRGGGLLANDWRGADAPVPAVKRQQPVFGRAKQLHLRAKPGTRQEELDRARTVVDAACDEVRASFVAVEAGEAIRTADLIDIVEGITASLVRDPFAFPSITRLRQRHEHTYLHSVSVSGLMIALANELRLDAQAVREAGLAGLLHDVGKAAIPGDILERQGRLTTDEDALLSTHPEKGGELLDETPGMPPVVADVCRHHHERPDGKGYPFGLTGEALSLHARMAAICNFYDNLTCPRPGLDKWSPGQAIEYLRFAKGQFDEGISTAFIRMIGAFLPGVLVRLNSDRIGVILDETLPDPMYPMVAVFQHRDGRSLAWQRVATKGDPILCIERPETWKFDDWPTLRTQLLALSE